mmetsp:Transcript_21719/g.32324  ORF Transcript_21719/g.32324 Transcript_21719/m.32324 type:complete len:215 (-) Transcript_21719:468-1112(-)
MTRTKSRRKEQNHPPQALARGDHRVLGAKRLERMHHHHHRHHRLWMQQQRQDQKRNPGQSKHHRRRKSKLKRRSRRIQTGRRQRQPRVRQLLCPTPSCRLLNRPPWLGRTLVVMICHPRTRSQVRLRSQRRTRKSCPVQPGQSEKSVLVARPPNHRLQQRKQEARMLSWIRHRLVVLLLLVADKRGPRDVSRVVVRTKVQEPVRRLRRRGRLVE